MDKIGRNDPCPCGSRRKYKVCCMNRPKAPRTAVVRKTISVELPIGTELIEQGNFFVKKGCEKADVPHQVSNGIFGKPRTQMVPNYATKHQVEYMPQWFKLNGQ